ncbi:SHOCT domain-containing protein [Cellulomonas palmilytica]|uniref:SHOCT domain-containing protein n=1 Tax=Cellulomonas palmilytica TaxID=2608402 RepID=UPI001F447E68|nr:SHOCT domain-containing protein [Cellulomonas palmilytica]UJP40797.1 SHOCT domain-containing protein [Cellulomonas palmilytica]
MPGLIRGVARTAVVAGTASAVSGRVHHRQQGRWAEQEAQAAYAQPTYAQPAPAAPVYAAQPVYAAPAPAEDELSMDEKIAHLKELAALRDSGVLTPTEFEVQKAKLLG